MSGSNRCLALMRSAWGRLCRGVRYVFRPRRRGVTNRGRSLHRQGTNDLPPQPRSIHAIIGAVRLTRARSVEIERNYWRVSGEAGRREVPRKRFLETSPETLSQIRKALEEQGELMSKIKTSDYASENTDTGKKEDEEFKPHLTT